LSIRQLRWALEYAAQQSASGTPAWQRDTEHIEKGSESVWGFADDDWHRTRGLSAADTKPTGQFYK
jgi:hypothetical protein